jgi:heme A synthase
MNMLTKAGAVATLSVAMLTSMQVNNAEAQRRGRNAAIGLGIVAGAIIAGAAVANARGERTYVRSRDCGEFRRNARYNEEIGRSSRAAYWWDRYSECRGE